MLNSKECWDFYCFSLLKEEEEKQNRKMTKELRKGIKRVKQNSEE